MREYGMDDVRDGSRGREIVSTLPMNVPLALARMAVHPESPVPLYEQICKSVRDAVRNGDLPPGTRLPTTRELAQMIGVARNTVVEAYTRLVAEGYLVSNTRRGTRVADQPPVRNPFEDLPPSTATGEYQAIAISYHARRLLDIPLVQSPGGRTLSLHAPDSALYPRNLLGRLIADEFRRAPNAEPRIANGELRRFQSAIAAHLRHARGVVCDPAQVIAVTGMEAAVDLVARVMIDPGHTVQIEDPTIDVIWSAFRAAGARLDPIPCDSQGANPARASGPPPRLIYVSPTVSFPHGVQMPEARRQEVFEAARASSAAIFECDIYGELLYSGSRCPAIQGMDREGRVLYCGSLNRTLGPGMRAGYLVVPIALIEPFAEMVRRLDSGPEPYLLAALATFIEQNGYALHMRRIRADYAGRLQALQKLLRIHLPDMTFSDPQGGLHLVLDLDSAAEEAAVCGKCAENGFAVAALSHFYLGNPRFGMVLGFGAIPLRMVAPAVKRLATAVEEGLAEARAMRAPQ